MAYSSPIRRLSAKWKTGQGWPQRLDRIAINGLRGWSGQEFKLNFPIMAVVGENGVGKSTVLQCAASIYQPQDPDRAGWFASDFFPDTAWEKVTGATILYTAHQGESVINQSLRKPGERWRGNPERPKRHVEYIDLSRIQPVPARTGFSKFAKPQISEASFEAFEPIRLERLSQVMGRQYDFAKMSLTDVDNTRSVPVLVQQGATYSGFHQGAGETTVTELLKADLPEYGLVLIDEIETSLHPRAQRRLIRDLAEMCRLRGLQVILTTHSPYVLDELPLDARAYIVQSGTSKSIVYGVSPEFAMSKMDDIPQYECDAYVEDAHSQRMLIEILARFAPDVVGRCRFIPYGAASVGFALGTMVDKNRFPRPSCVFVDGDQAAARGCVQLPGDDAPERVVFEQLRAKNWLAVGSRTGRSHSEISDACNQSMTLSDHHDWLRTAATKLVLGGDTLWQAMCAEWAALCLDADVARKVTQPVEDALHGIATGTTQMPIDDAQLTGRLF